MTKRGDGIQVDKGDFVRVHHTILELLAKAPLRGQQLRCLMFLFRATYGYNKKEAKISLKEWADGTGMMRQNVWRELQGLLASNVIYARSEGAKRSMTWGFNKYHEEWNLKSVVADDDKSVITYDYKSVVADDYRFSESVVTDDYKAEKSVIVDDDKSVITRSHTRDLKDKKTTTTTTEPCGSGGSFFASHPHGEILRYWERNMRTEMTEALADQLTETIGVYGEDAVIDSVRVAVAADVRTLRYVKGVLNRRSPPNGTHMNGTGNHSGKVLIDDD